MFLASEANTGLAAVIGYVVMALGVAALAVVTLFIIKKVQAKIQVSKEAAKKAYAPTPNDVPAPQAPAAKPTGPAAPGSAGSLKLHDVEPKTAAMLMAIVADKMGKPINELRFTSIREVK